MCVSLPLASVFCLMSLAWCCPIVKDVTQGWVEGIFFLLLTVSRRGEEGVAFSPAELSVTPRREGRLLPWWPVQGKFLQSEVGDIYTQGQAEWLSAARAGELGYFGHSEAVVCGQVGPRVCPACLVPCGESVCPGG